MGQLAFWFSFGPKCPEPKLQQFCCQHQWQWCALKLGITDFCFSLLILSPSWCRDLSSPYPGSPLFPLEGTWIWVSPWRPLWALLSKLTLFSWVFSPSSHNGLNALSSQACCWVQKPQGCPGRGPLSRQEATGWRGLSPTQTASQAGFYQIHQVKSKCQGINWKVTF